MRKPHQRGAALAAATLGLGLALTGAGSSTAATKPKGDPVVSQVRIATFNTAATMSTRRAVSDLRELAAAGPDVIALQEMASPERRRWVRENLVSCAECPYDAYMPTWSAVQGSTPILYRSDRFTLLGSGTQQVTQDTYVGPRGAGPSTIRAKYVNWVRLRDLTTRRQVYVLNNHAVPTVQTGNGGPNSLAKRVEIYRKHMTGLVAMVQQIKATTGGTVFVTGDLNVNYRSDRVVRAPMFPFAQLGGAGLRASYAPLGEPETGTHVLSNGFDRRLIDYVYFLERRAVSPRSQTIMRGMNADHRPLLVDFELRSRGCWVRGTALC